MSRRGVRVVLSKGPTRHRFYSMTDASEFLGVSKGWISRAARKGLHISGWSAEVNAAELETGYGDSSQRALMGPAPCDACRYWTRCQEWRMACDAFADFIERGHVRDPPDKYQPSKEKYAAIFDRSVDRRHAHSNAKRQAAKKKRREQAEQLHADGLGKHEIARKMNVSIRSVREYLR